MFIRRAVILTAITLTCVTTLTAPTATAVGRPVSPAVTTSDVHDHFTARLGQPTQVTTLAHRQANYLHSIVESHDARDLTGAEPSLYRGKFYRPTMERVRKCIGNRESSFGYRAISESGTYRGAYQISPELAAGVTWMMQPEHKQLLGNETAKAILANLRKTPINKWSRYWQDAAWHTIANYEYTGSGLAHWDGGAYHC